MPHSGDESAARLDALDGLRALAVLAVALYHYCYFWTPAGSGTSLVAYGETHAWIPFVGSGYLGVHLFFIISGFVILLTLEKTEDPLAFLLRRAIRLWPALLLFGTATFLIVSNFGPPSLRVGWWEYLSSLLVLPPQHVGLLLGGRSWQWLDGAYWSLFVEVKFYFLAAAIYFGARRHFITAWIGYELCIMLIGVLAWLNGGLGWHMVAGFLFHNYLPYFSFGIAAYLLWSGRATRGVYALMCLAVVHAGVAEVLDLIDHPRSTAWLNAEHLIGTAAIFGLFYCIATRRLVLAICQWPLLVRTGRASYGIYLVHQNVGVTILSLPFFASGLPAYLGPVAVIVLVTAIAIVVFEKVETPIQAGLKRRLLARPVATGLTAQA
ncbi:MAG: acyltransferase [Hyphomicrobium sp.]